MSYIQALATEYCTAVCPISNQAAVLEHVICTYSLVILKTLITMADRPQRYCRRFLSESEIKLFLEDDERLVTYNYYF